MIFSKDPGRTILLTDAIFSAISGALDSGSEFQSLEASAIRAVIDDMPEGCQIITRDWRYLYLNRTAVEHSRKKREEIIGRTMMECYPGIESTPLFHKMETVMHDREPQSLQTVFTYPDGRTGSFDVHITPHPQGVVVHTVDITEKKTTEEQAAVQNKALQTRAAKMEAEALLRTRELEIANERLQSMNVILTRRESDLQSQTRKLETAYRNLGDAYGEMARFRQALNAAAMVSITDEKGEIIEVNDNFCGISGWSRKELIGQTHRIMNSGYHPREFFDTMWKTISQGNIWKGEIRNLKKDGTMYWADTTISPIVDSSGKPLRFVAIHSDITQRKEAEARVDHTTNHLRVLQDRMSPHFLFNTLSVIHAFLETNPELADEAILMLAENYRFLIHNSHKEMIPFEVAWEFMSNYARLIGLRHMDMIGIDISKSGDFSKFQIPLLTLQPLVENAYKHGLRGLREGGMVTVTAQIDGEIAVVKVRDNGVGLMKSNIFAGTLGGIAERLRYYLPGSDLRIENHPDGGVIATVVIQMKKERLLNQ